MNNLVLHTVCPMCGETFSLKFSKLRKWNRAKKINPARRGPFCHYKCSGRFNFMVSSAVRLLKVSKDSRDESRTRT